MCASGDIPPKLPWIRRPLTPNKLTEAGEYLDGAEAGFWPMDNRIREGVELRLRELVIKGKLSTPVRQAISRSCVLSDIWQAALNERATVDSRAPVLCLVTQNKR